MQISFEDNGTGISVEDMAHITEPYFTRKKNGSGLGLFIVQRILHEHGGHLELLSNPGHGTTARIFLPLAERRVRLLGPGEKPAATKTGGVKKGRHPSQIRPSKHHNPHRAAVHSDTSHNGFSKTYPKGFHIGEPAIVARNLRECRSPLTNRRLEVKSLRELQGTFPSETWEREDL